MFVYVCRKKKAVHKTTSTDDKRLQNTLKRLGVNTIPGIEEVNIFKDDQEVVHFVNPKGEATRPKLSRISARTTPSPLHRLQFKHPSPLTPTSSAGHHKQRVGAAAMRDAQLISHHPDGRFSPLAWIQPS
jgi:NACalpha-BTF3-like transcription factor